jgi:aminopeptidase N
MDEGINTYYEKRYIEEKYFKLSRRATRILSYHRDSTILSTLIRSHKDQPIEGTSDNFTFLNYGLIVYTKSSLWIKQLERELGKDLFDRCMQSYYKQWRFKHPYPDDFKKSIEKTSGRSIDKLYQKLFQRGSLDE